MSPGEVRGAGSIRGIVRLQGTPPEMKEIANRPCHDRATPIREETVVVGNDGGLANVFVFLEGLPAVDGSTLAPALLDQDNCRYVPHAVGVCVGQSLTIRSSDPTMHNVHYNPDRNDARNFGMTQAGQEKLVSFREAEFIRVKCDVHPWMTAYIGVFDNPFFTVSDTDGSFEISGFPSGRYRLVAWHERYGKLEQEVAVDGKSPGDVELVFRAQ